METAMGTIMETKASEVSAISYRYMELCVCMGRNYHIN